MQTVRRLDLNDTRLLLAGARRRAEAAVAEFTAPLAA